MGALASGQLYFSRHLIKRHSRTLAHKGSLQGSPRTVESEPWKHCSHSHRCREDRSEAWPLSCYQTKDAAITERRQSLENCREGEWASRSSHTWSLASTSGLVSGPRTNNSSLLESDKTEDSLCRNRTRNTLGHHLFNHLSQQIEKLRPRYFSRNRTQVSWLPGQHAHHDSPRAHLPFTTVQSLMCSEAQGTPCYVYFVNL